MNHEAQRAAADFLKKAEKRFSEVNENDNERTANSAIPQITQKAKQFRMNALMVSIKNLNSYVLSKF